MKRDPRKAIGAFVKSVRESAGFKDQSSFADRAGVSPSYVNKLEAGEATPSAELLLLLVRDFAADAVRARRLFAAVSESDVDEKWAKAAARIGVVA